MKKTALFVKLFLVMVLLTGAWGTAFADGEYIPVHTKEELDTLFTRVNEYLDLNQKKLDSTLDDTERQIVTSATVRAWGITQYEDATSKQIDDAYNALFNMSMLLGLKADTADTFSSGALFEYAVQLLDQEYYDLLAQSGEDPETIEYAEYLRGVAEGLVETPEEFTPEMVEEYLLGIYQETYLSAALKTIAYTEQLPLPEELFPQENGGNTMMPNPMVEYYSAEPLSKMLGIQWPELPESFEGKLGYYSIIADIVAESQYDFADGGKLILRLSPEINDDISGVYGASFYEDWIIAGTRFEISTYQKMLIAHGTVLTMDGKPYSFAVDAENMDKETFRKVVTFFIEHCRNQKAAH